jgi:hypothetical protein
LRQRGLGFGEQYLSLGAVHWQVAEDMFVCFLSGVMKFASCFTRFESFPVLIVVG